MRARVFGRRLSSRPGRACVTTTATVALLAGATALVVRGEGAAQDVDPEALARAVREVERIDAMRSALAGTLARSPTPPDPETFEQVCKPVGAEAHRVALENGWRFVQMAVRYRNPAHQADAEAASAMAAMHEDGAIRGLWLRTAMEGDAGTRYLRRITVEPSCLACHGERDARPDFVKENYPDDRAFGFANGDLRGVYSVFLPDPR